MNFQHFKLVRKALLGVAVASLMACAIPSEAQKVTTDYDHRANFESYHTFSFHRVSTSNPLFEQRVREAITRDLQARGWQMVPSDGDIAITAIGNVKNVQEYTTFYDNLGPGFGWGGWGGRWGYGGWGGGSDISTTSQRDIPVGTLIVDLYDTKTHNLVFRGQASDELHQKHTEKNIEIVNKSVDKMFDHFPPKGARS